MKRKAKKKLLNYKDRKWEIMTDKNGSVAIFCKCHCGHESDIAFDRHGEYIGSGQTI